MARNINDIYNFYRDLVRKERGVFITIPQFNSYMDVGQLDALNEYFQSYAENQTIHDALRPFRVYYQFTSASDGTVTFPSDYIHMIGPAFTVTGSTLNEITPANEDEWVGVVGSQLRPVSTSAPISRQIDGGFVIVPQTTQTGFFSYLRRPDTPFLAVTQVGRTVTYDAAGSTQLEWTDNYINNIIAKALRYASVYMDEKGVLDFANQYNQETK